MRAEAFSLQIFDLVSEKSRAVFLGEDYSDVPRFAGQRIFGFISSPRQGVASHSARIQLCRETELNGRRNDF